MLRLALIAAALLPASCGTTLGVATSARGAVRTVHLHRLSSEPFSFEVD